MPLAQAAALVAATVFFGVGLLAGCWKYAAIRRSPTAAAPAYVDVFHRAALLYAFAALLLERLVEISRLPAALELPATLALVAFFAYALVGYAVHGWLDDTDNQLRPPYRLGARQLPPWLVHGSMAALIAAEVGGFAVLAFGVVTALAA